MTVKYFIPNTPYFVQTGHNGRGFEIMATVNYKNDQCSTQFISYWDTIDGLFIGLSSMFQELLKAENIEKHITQLPKDWEKSCNDAKKLILEIQKELNEKSEKLVSEKQPRKPRISTEQCYIPI